jgi:RNA polymerase sigma factor (sigma-70 family)
MMSAILVSPSHIQEARGMTPSGDGSTSMTLLQRVRLHRRHRADPEACERFVAVYAPLIRRRCLRMGLQPADADDVSHDVLLRVLDRIDLFERRRTGSFRKYLANAVRWAVLDFRRTRAEANEHQAGSALAEVEASAPAEEEISDGEVRQGALELQPDYEDDPGMRERFLAEARITGQLEHPGIAPVYRMVERPGRPPAYAMRLVRGRTLLEAVLEFHAKGGVGSDAVALRDLLQAFVSVCQTLAYAHSRGVLHRDLKGENIVLGQFGEVVVLDWGIAKVVGEAEAKGSAVKPLPRGKPEATAPGAAPGTMAYMAPEQARGEADCVDRRSDVFGLGAVLYLILTGRAPYVAPEWIDVLIQAQAGRVTPPRRLARQVPRALEAVCLKALAKERVDRYRSAAELGDEVKRWLAGEPVTACPEPMVLKARRWLRKHRVLASAAAAALLVALGAAGWFGYQEHQREQAVLAAARERDREAEGLLGEIEGLRAAAKQVQPALAKVQLNPLKDL